MPIVGNNLSYGGRHNSIFRDSLVQRSLIIKGTAAIRKVIATTIETDRLTITGGTTTGVRSTTSALADLSNGDKLMTENAVKEAIDNVSSGSGTSYSATNRLDAEFIADGSVDNAEFQRLSGVTDSIQTQLNGKQASGNYHPLTAVDSSGSSQNSSNLITSGAVYSDLTLQSGAFNYALTFYPTVGHLNSAAAGKVIKRNTANTGWEYADLLSSVSLTDITGWPSTVDATELEYLNGMTGDPIQTQLDARVPIPSGILAGQVVKRNSNNDGWESGDASSTVALADITDWPSAVNATEVASLDGMTGDPIQTQLNGKLTSVALADITDWPSTVNATEVASLDGMIGDPIQTQLNALRALCLEEGLRYRRVSGIYSTLSPQSTPPYPALSTILTFFDGQTTATAAQHQNVSARRVITTNTQIIETQGDLGSNYSQCWHGFVTTLTSTATSLYFRTYSDDGSHVYVDGTMAVNNGGNHGAQFGSLGTVTTTLNQQHEIHIFHYEDSQGAQMKFEWSIDNINWSDQLSGSSDVKFECLRLPFSY